MLTNPCDSSRNLAARLRRWSVAATVCSLLSPLLVLSLLVLSLLGLPITSTAGWAGRSLSGQLQAAEPTRFRVYLGTYNAAATESSPGSKGIYRCELDTAAGTLSQPELAGEVINPSFLAIHPNRQFLYAVTEMQDAAGKRQGAVGAFAIDAATGNLRLLNKQPSGGAGPCHVSIDKTGRVVLVANYGGGSCASLPVQADGSLAEPASIQKHQGTSVNTKRQEAPHAHSINIDPSNRYAVCADLGIDKVMIYRLDVERGTMTANDPAFAAVEPGAGPRHFAYHPTGKFAYVINELTSTITAFAHDTATGKLTTLQTISSLPDGFSGNNSTAEVVVHPSGKFLYGSNRGHNSIVALAIDQQTGKLSLVGHQGDKIKVPRNFAIDPTGKFALVGNQDGDSVVMFRVDQETGKLLVTGQSIQVGKPVCVRFLPLDGAVPETESRKTKNGKNGDNGKAAKAGKAGKNSGEKNATEKTAAKKAAATAPPARKEPPATPPEQLKVPAGFQVELLYSVPKDMEGSWVNMCMDPQGRLIVSDQYGGLYRVTPPAIGGAAADTKVEKLPLEIGEAQGLLWAFDSLYIVVNKGQKFDSGLYRARDTNGDGELDQVEQLRKINGGGEHGPHAVLLSPDKKSLHIVCGNGTKLTELAGSNVPLRWGEDHLLPRMPDGRGFMRDVLAPGGCVYQVDPDGRNWQLIANGFRNQYDAAFNRHGDLFAYDADMEWDINTPWYRPTRVCLVTSGAEFGWRNGAGKWPVHYLDSLPAVANVGPGSPTGVTFGYGAKFPAKYQEALYLCDWSYGKLYALHLQPDGSAYRGTLEEFITGTPLPLTDVLVNPRDGAMYFTIGGRRTKSGLYRVTYRGAESTAESKSEDTAAAAAARKLRRSLEAFHGRQDAQAVDAAWPHLDSSDRFIRFAARVAIEHQDVSTWQARALAETRPHASINALLALVRCRAQDPFHRQNRDETPDAVLRAAVLKTLGKMSWEKLSDEQRVDLARVYQVTLNRLGPPTDSERQAIIAQLASHFPTEIRELNAELAQLLVYLEAPETATKLVAMLLAAPTQEEQIEYARALRMVKNGWTAETRKSYFQWFGRASGYRGGASFALFVQNIKNDAIKSLSEEEREALRPIIDAAPVETARPQVAPARPHVKAWTMAELTPRLESGLQGRNFARGRTLFAAANCFACHRFDNEGGALGPDLTQLAGRFSKRDILESIMEPSKVISDQYAAVTITTDDGKVITGRIVNLANEDLILNTNMLEPNVTVKVEHRRIEQLVPSKVSMMPEGLLNTLQEDEILDLMAYLVSRGDRNHAMFK